MRYVVSYSGGKSSFATAARMVETHGADAVTLIFADTLIEDEDLYRFLREGAEALGCEFIWLQDGRDPWQVFRDQRYIGNSRVAPCSRILKTDQVKAWMKENCDTEATHLCLGITWDEKERLPRAQNRWQGWTVRAPLCESPMWTQQAVDQALERYGLDQPRLYKYGFVHNNCGGFCVQGGQGQFKALWEQFPERYAHHEQQMEAVMRDIPTTRPFLKQTDRSGETQYISLRDWRKQLESNPQMNLIPTGGCGCFIDDGDEE